MAPSEICDVFYASGYDPLYLAISPAPHSFVSYLFGNSLDGWLVQFETPVQYPVIALFVLGVATIWSVLKLQTFS